jgi:hypothetical protein
MVRLLVEAARWLMRRSAGCWGVGCGSVRSVGHAVGHAEAGCVCGSL